MVYHDSSHWIKLTLVTLQCKTFLLKTVLICFYLWILIKLLLFFPFCVYSFCIVRNRCQWATLIRHPFQQWLVLTLNFWVHFLMCPPNVSRCVSIDRFTGGVSHNYFLAYSLRKHCLLIHAALVYCLCIVDCNG